MEKETRLFELPNGWVWTKLVDITLPITRTSRTSEDSNEEFWYIEIEAIDNNSQTIKEIKTYTWRKCSFLLPWLVYLPSQ